MAEWGHVLSCRSRTPFWGNVGHFNLMAMHKHHCYIVSFHIVCCALMHHVCEKHAFVIPKHRSYHFASGPHNLHLFWSWRTEVFLSILVLFAFRVWRWINVSSPVTVHLKNSWPLTEYCCKNDRAQIICCFLWSFISAWRSQSAHTLFDPKPWMMLTSISCSKFKSCCSLLTVICLLLWITFSISVQLSAVLAVLDLLLLSQSSVLTLPWNSAHHLTTLCQLITSSP
jgi:hypothetical protein